MAHRRMMGLGEHEAQAGFVEAALQACRVESRV